MAVRCRARELCHRHGLLEDLLLLFGVLLDPFIQSHNLAVSVVGCLPRHHSLRSVSVGVEGKIR